MDSTSTGGRSVALGGFMGVGKSTVGRRLASMLGLPLVDIDHELARRHGPVPEQIRREGLAAFRARERALVGELADGRPRVIATGGGVFADAEARAVLSAIAWTVTLDAPLPVLRVRVGAGAARPLWDGEVARRFAARRESYRDVDLVVDAARSPTAVARDIARWVSAAERQHVRVDTPYSVEVRTDLRGLGAGVRRACGARRCVLVTDRNVAPLWGARAVEALRDGGVQVLGTVVLPAGEAHKTVDTWRRCIDALLAHGISRVDAVIALGGGVLGDLAGFAAASVLRGVPLIQVPTTLLAMVDSSVGGKVAVDHPSGKNLVGALHHPALVWAPVEVLRTLPEREIRAGLAEALKIGLAFDPDFVRALTTRSAGAALSALSGRVARAVALKAAVVERDPLERGERAILNLGHTVGHAIERVAGFGTILHGEAVAIGLVAEARIAERLGLSPAGVADEVQHLVAALGLPVEVPPSARPGLAQALALDKKRQGAMLRVPLLECVGRATLRDIPMSIMQDQVSSL